MNCFSFLFIAKPIKLHMSYYPGRLDSFFSVKPFKIWGVQGWSQANRQVQLFKRLRSGVFCEILSDFSFAELHTSYVTNLKVKRVCSDIRIRGLRVEPSANWNFITVAYRCWRQTFQADQNHIFYNCSMFVHVNMKYFSVMPSK